MQHPLVRYLVFQIPGWLFAVVLLWWLWPWTGLDGRLALLVLALVVVKDFAIYPLVRRAYEPPPPTGAPQLIGLRGEARETLTPTGWVRVRGELWQAEAAPTEPPIAAGAAIEVLAARGRRLIVRRA